MADEQSVTLLPCPFCGEALFHNGNQMNAYGRCETEDCWMHERKCTVPLDDARQVAAWNTRAHSQAGEVEAIRGFQSAVAAFCGHGQQDLQRMAVRRKRCAQLPST